MSKHRKSKKYSGRYDEINEYNDYGYTDQYGNQYVNGDNGNVFNKLSSILGNIDINQITSLLNVLGVVGKSGDKSVNENSEQNSSKESDDSYDSDINIFELVSQAKAVNDMIMNENAEIYNYDNNKASDEEDDDEYLEVKEESNKRSKHSKKRSRKKEESKREEEKVNDTSENVYEKNIENHLDDPIVLLLNAMQSLVVEDKARIINKILELYIEGKI